MASVEDMECRNLGMWKIWSRKWRVWKRWSVEIEECGNYGV